MMYDTKYEDGGRFGFDEVQERVLNRELASTLAISNDRKELDGFVNHLIKCNKFCEYDIDCVIIDVDCDVDYILETLNGLLKYSLDCKNIIKKHGCASLNHYNRKVNNLITRRTMVVLPDIDGLIRKFEPSQIKRILQSLIKLEVYSGVFVIACSGCGEFEGVDFKFLSAFANKALFGVSDRRLVNSVSLGMYRSTDMLESNEFYYFGMDSSNGMLLCV